MSNLNFLDGDDRDDEADSFLSRNIRRCAGLGIVAVAVLTALALATWNVDDPSLTHATDRPVTNLLGFPGSAVADLLLQFLGLSALLAIALPTIWGLRLFRDQLDELSPKSYGYYGGSIALAAAILSFFPVPASWPLPTGLGGIIGTALSAPFFWALGEPLSIGLAVLIILALCAPFLFCLVRAANPDRWKTEPERQTSGNKRKNRKISVDEAFDEPEETTFPSLVAGAIVHWSYMAASAARRLLHGRGGKQHNLDISPFDEALDDEPAGGDLGMLGGLRKLKARFLDDPIADDGLGDYLKQISGPSDEPEGPYDSDGFDNRIQEPGITESAPDMRAIGIAGPEASAGPVVGRKAPRARQGRRAITEAQAELPMMGEENTFVLPPLNFLKEAPEVQEDQRLSAEALAHNAELLEGVLDDFGVKGEIVHVRPGPVVTLYELEPAPGIKSSRVIGLADDIARSMSAIAARVAVIPGKNAIGIELPNAKRETVYLHEMVSSKAFESQKGKLPICLGKTIGGESVIADLARMPHLLVAGTTGSGKSVAINTMILSLLYRFTAEQCKLIMIDPKMLELSVYDGIPHLLTPVVTDPKKAVVALKWTVREMEERYRKMSKVGVRNIDGFNQRVKHAADSGEPLVRTIQTGYDHETGEAVYEHEELDMSPMPYIVVIIDEMADLMMVAGKDIEGAIQRLAQMARAAGIHVIMATQRPSVDVITGTIKANFPTRISFQVTSKIDSRTILGEQGAEQLLGMGDMLYMAGGGRIQRVHGPFVSDGEVENIVRHLQAQGVPQYVEAVTEEIDEGDGSGGGASGGDAGESADPYDQAVAVVLRDKKASTSYIQRRLGIGYNRAASIIERMEEEGIVGPANHAGKREILVGSDPDEDFS